MNERIHKLADQCRIETYGVNGELLYEGFDEKMFAELIVRECVSICVQNQFDGAENYNNGSVSSAELIKQHFGVE